MALNKDQARTVWISRLRWFFAELVVVIAGILIALALQSSWQNRGNVRSERKYLEQLLEDTRENIALVNARIARDSVFRQMSARMAAILRDRLPLPSQDSLVQLSRMSTSSFSLVTATFDALVASGDIKLLQNPRLRTSTLAIANEIGRSTATLARNVESQTRWVELRTTRMLYHVGPPVRGETKADPLDIQWWSRVDFRDMQGDPEAVRAFQMNVYTLNNSVGSLHALLKPLADYEAELERELAVDRHN